MMKTRGTLSLYKKINSLLLLGTVVTIFVGVLNFPNWKESSRVPSHYIPYFSSLGATFLALCVLYLLENKVTKYLQVLLIFVTGVMASFDNPLAFDCIGLWSICFLLAFGYGFISKYKVVYVYIVATLSVFLASVLLNQSFTAKLMPSISYFLVLYIIHLMALLSIVKTKIDESALLVKAAELDRFFSTDLDLFCILDNKGRFIRANPEWTVVFGYSGAELEAMSILDIIHPGDLPFVTSAFAPKKAMHETLSSTLRCRCADGSYRNIELRSSRHDSVLYVSARDITERIQHGEQLQKNLLEKTILIKELYHRTKNNMQVIMSMIYLKSFNHPDPLVGETLQDLNRRISALSLAQQLLYKSSELSRINIKDYLNLLSGAVIAAYPSAKGRIMLKQECVDLELLIDEAIPCGLLINELLANSYKHAFPDGRSGTISLSFTVFAEKRILLLFKDDGVGLPDDFNIDTAESFGLSLVKSLSEYQLAGTCNITRENGLGFSISFPINTHKERVFHEYPNN